MKSFFAILFTAVIVLAVQGASAAGAGPGGGGGSMGGMGGGKMGGMGGMNAPRQDTGTLQRQRQTDRDTTRDQDRDRDRIVSKDAIYGAELMTDRELQRYQDRLRTMQTAEERNRFLEQHRTTMDARAKQRGVTVKDVQNQERQTRQEQEQYRSSD
jgi:hypothetical protein